MRWRIERQLLRVNPHAVATCRHAIASIDTTTITASGVRIARLLIGATLAWYAMLLVFV